MNLNMHIASHLFVQSHRPFGQSSYVHTFSTPYKASIGLPHHYLHSYLRWGHRIA